MGVCAEATPAAHTMTNATVFFMTVPLRGPTEPTPIELGLMRPSGVPLDYPGLGHSFKTGAEIGCNLSFVFCQCNPSISLTIGPYATISPANTTDTIEISLIRMFSDGPEVSLNGSPTVSPTTAALWSSDPLPYT